MYRTPNSQGNRLARNKSVQDEEEERRRKAREKALMRKLSSEPGPASSGSY